jgi:hypothetical protein
MFQMGAAENIMAISAVPTKETVVASATIIHISRVINFIAVNASVK